LKTYAARVFPADHPVRLVLNATPDELPPAEFRQKVADLLVLSEIP
jgi:hypothetical protein